jgi:hypothetical protein
LGASVDHLGAGVLVLTLAGERDREHLALGVLAISQTAGYFIVTFEPMLPSIHSMVAPASARAAW